MPTTVSTPVASLSGAVKKRVDIVPRNSPKANHNSANKSTTILILVISSLPLLSLLVPPQAAAWTLFFVQLQLGTWSTCFFSNTMASNLFLQAHQAHFGPNPTKVAPTPVFSLSREQYSYEALRVASSDFTEPVVVRGLFSDVPAMQWANSSLPGNDAFEALAQFNVSVIQNSTLGKDHWINCGGHGADTAMQNFGEASARILADDRWSSAPSQTLILPPASRTHREVDEGLDKTFAGLVERDLDLRRMGGGGWGAKGVFNAVITQLWMGSGKEDASMGTGWHCDICNSFKIQLEGSKKWTFIHGKYSRLMRPTMKAGKTAAAGADISVRSEVEPFIERQEVILEKGDFLYNPDFYWHNVVNEPGLTMAVAARECNFTRYARANPLLSSIIILNHGRAAVAGDLYAWTRLKGAFRSLLER
jgi:hypothetical protein